MNIYIYIYFFTVFIYLINLRQQFTLGFLSYVDVTIPYYLFIYIYLYLLFLVYLLDKFKATVYSVFF